MLACCCQMIYPINYRVKKIWGYIRNYKHYSSFWSLIISVLRTWKDKIQWISPLQGEVKRQVRWNSLSAGEHSAQWCKIYLPFGNLIVAIESGLFLLIYLIKMVIFYSYVSLPEGICGYLFQGSLIRLSLRKYFKTACPSLWRGWINDSDVQLVIWCHMYSLDLEGRKVM